MNDIFKLNSFNIYLLDKCISQYTEHPVFAIGSIMCNIAPRKCTLKYCPPREWNTENQLFQYYPSLEDDTEIDHNDS